MSIIHPLVFDTYARAQVWGHRRLAARLGKALPAEGTFGEMWEISAHPLHVSRVIEGPLRGTPLTELWNAHARELCGDRGTPSQFPWLVKFLDCHETLSVQVHPDDETARRLLGDEQGKTEAWVVIDAEPTARIHAGLRAGTTRSSFEQHLAAGTVAECLHSFVPRPGDCLLLRAGTVHSVGGGVLLAEVQQTSDATFRLYDWGRVGPDGQPRTLHVEQALESIDWNAGPVDPLKPEPIAGTELITGSEAGAGEQLAQCQYFELTRWRPRAALPLPCSERLSIWMVLDGQATLASRDGSYAREFRTGECVLVPATASPLEWTPGSEPPTLLAVSLPS